MTPPGTTIYSFKRGDYHRGVWCLQRFFNSIGYPRTAEDFDFGAGTELLVKRYQSDTGAAIDGVVGPQTQARIVRSCVVRAPFGSSLPKGLIEGQINAESGRNLAAVNWNVPGGVDCGLTQRRVYGPPFDAAKEDSAFDPRASVSASVKVLHDNYVKFSARLGQGEYAWRVAMLAWNWPYAAEELSRRRPISDTRACSWCNYPHTKFDDGTPVYSWRDWTEYYAIGSKAHNHPGAVTRLAFGVPMQ